MQGRITLATILSLLTAPALSEGPSYDCSRARLPTEHAVCADPELSRLDLAMARAFRGASRDLATADRDALRDKQLLWQRWRNTCRADAACLARRYQQRIIDFGSASPPAATEAPVTARLRDGKYERIYADGTIRWTHVGGGGGGVTYPDGTQQVFSFVQVTPDDLPNFPGSAAPWAEMVETSLLTVIDGILPSEDHAEYRNLHAGHPVSERIFRHIDAIGFLSDG